MSDVSNAEVVSDERVREQGHAQADEGTGSVGAKARGLQKPRPTLPRGDGHGEGVGSGDQDGVQDAGSKFRERLPHRGWRELSISAPGARKTRHAFREEFARLTILSHGRQ